MKVFLVVMFLMQDGSYLPGDIIAPDGWSSIEFPTMEQCLPAEDRINQNFAKSQWAGKVYGVCIELPYKPELSI